MTGNQNIWKDWADTLYRWGVGDLLAALLDATGPLNSIGAQVIYLGQPVLNTILPEDHVNAFANLLENPEETRAFTSFLRDGRNSV